MVENELSFLILKMPELTALKRAEIEQHYLTAGPEPLRLRKKNSACELTKKFSLSGGDLSRKEELNIPLRADEFDRFKTLSLKSLTKTRYYLPLENGLIAEIDVFHGPLDGLAMVEVEFPDETSRAVFAPPPWFGRDVSQEEWSGNAYLAGKSFDEISRFAL